ncbi:hypothetical protein ACEQ8H_001499 [Pleosporales sp. CAS-2024a]
MPAIMEREGSRSSSTTSEAIAQQLHGTAATAAAKESGLAPQNTSSSDTRDHVGPVASDDAFGNEQGAEIHYKTCAWWHTGVLMLAENVSLGVLSLPQALAILGLVPGLLCIFFLGIIATYTGYIIGEFKLAYPRVQSFADCGMLIGGPILRDMFAAGQVLILIFIQGAHILTFSVAMNAITDHAICTIWWNVIGMVVCLGLGLPRTFKNVSYLSIFSCLSIIIAVTVAMVAIGMEKPDVGNILALRPHVPLIKGLGPVLNIVLAYTGHVAFFSFQAELKDPRDFKKALFLEQGIAVVFYMTISVVIYYYAGPLVASPALGSASPIVTKIAFGIALPTIIVAGVVNGSVACKYMYVRMWSGTNVVHQRSFRSMSSWYGICMVVWIISWLLAEVIPSFNTFLGFIGAMFGSWFSYAIPPCLWLYQYKSIIVTGIVIFALGMWSSVTELASGTSGRPFSCANNWQPTSWVAPPEKHV